MPHPPIEPYETGMLDAGDGNLIYWEACGNPGASSPRPGHGSGTSPGPRTTGSRPTSSRR